jgi:hypothetical protein
MLSCLRQTPCLHLLRGIVAIGFAFELAGVDTAKPSVDCIFRSIPPPMQRLSDLAEGQWGLVTTQQARLSGVGWSSLAYLRKEGLLERVAHGVYRIRAGGELDHLALRAAWLQLEPEKPAWARLDDPAVAFVSHASAAALYGVGALRPDLHEFTLPIRRQTSRPDIRLHRGKVPDQSRLILRGLPVTRADWMIRDLLADHVEPAQIAEITAEVIDKVFDDLPVVAETIAQYATRFNLPHGDGAALLDFLLMLARSDPPAIPGQPRRQGRQHHPAAAGSRNFVTSHQGNPLYVAG